MIGEYYVSTINNNVKLDYSDVLIVPQFSDIDSRSKVVIDYNPIIASNMDGVGTFAMARAMYCHGAHTAIVKHYTHQQWIDFIEECLNDDNIGPVTHSYVSTGISKDDYELTTSIIREIKQRTGQPANICVDVANGYMQQFYDFVARLRDENPHSVIMAGSVVTPNAVTKLESAGANLIKVGIGSGAVCTTRIKTGIGYPQLSAVLECVEACKKSDIVADGGITNPGDVCKALAAGAKYVKLGSMLAGHDEGGQPIVDNKVVFYGMSSKTAQVKHKGELASYRSSEGRTVSIPYKGPVTNTMHDILGGIRSCCAYVGANKVSRLSMHAEFIRVNNQYNRSMEPYTVSL